MKRNIRALETEKYDLIVIGGGIIGTGIARDASLRGIKTLLLEKDDFGCGTTSRSSRLIHGGLRYLRMMQFHLVRQDLHEREVLLRIAPHLVHPYPFIMPMTAPIYTIALRIGVPLYDLLSYDKSMPNRHYLSKREAVRMEPSLSEAKKLYGAYMYYDCQAPYAERLGIENVLSAWEHGAQIINHATVTGFLREGKKVTGVVVRDEIGKGEYRVNARLVINAAGQWVDCVRDLLQASPAGTIRRTKGIHLVTPCLSNKALVLLSPIDNRLFFVMPWLGYSLIGSTDTDYHGDIEAPAADPEDVTYTLAGVRQIFPGLTVKDVFYTTAGLRPLIFTGGEKPSQASREHKILDHRRKDGVDGIISVLGGKITAYRAVARDAVDLAAAKLGVKARCVTADNPLPGAPAVPRDDIEKAARESRIELEVVEHLAELYGSRFKGVIGVTQKSSLGGRRICPHCKDIMSQVQHAVEEECALTVSDFLLRRSLSGLAQCQGLDAVEMVAEEMGRLLSWSDEERSRQAEAYRAQAKLAQSFRFEA